MNETERMEAWVNEEETPETPATEPETKPDSEAEITEPSETEGEADTPEDEPDEEPEDEEEEEELEVEDKSKINKAFARQRAKLKAKIDAEREARIRLEERIAILSETVEGTNKTPQQVNDSDPEPVPPNPADFNTLAELDQAVINFHKDMGAWSARQEFARQRQETEAREKQATEEARKQEYNASIEGKTALGEKEYDDFREVAIENPKVVAIMEKYPHLKEGIGESDNFVKLAYYYGKKPGELLKLAQMGEKKALVEIGKMEERLTSKTKTPSEAKPPIRPVDSSGKVEIDEDNLSTEEWMKLEAKRLKEGRSRI